ncbi:MAG TPA: M15 family metallopeptidase [Blastocatellia bacterium]
MKTIFLRSGSACILLTLLAATSGFAASRNDRQPGDATSGSDIPHSTARRGKTGVIEKPSECTPCAAKVIARNPRLTAKQARAIKSIPCHQADYVDPTVKKDLNAALADMKRVGIKPKITSAWRSSGEQEQIYKCTSNWRCRRAHPGLYKALPPGGSAHEAGLALDISGVAAGPRGANHLTSQGRRIVQIMTKHGFRWKYGLRDPVHFEANPAEHGYRNLQQAIHVTQTKCDAQQAIDRLAAQKKRSAARNRQAALTPVSYQGSAKNSKTRRRPRA